MTTEIRRLGEADAEVYRALFRDGLAREPDAFLLTAGEAAAIPLEATRARLAEGWLFGAFDDGRLVGIAGGRRHGLARQAHRMVVGPVYVAEGARGRGLARQLLGTLVDAARSGGLLQLELEVDAANAAAIALYDSLGFVRVGTMPRAVRLGAGFGDDHTLVRSLD